MSNTTALRIRRLAVPLFIQLALAAAPLMLLASCDAPGPNGKSGVLFFDDVQFPMSRYLENSITIPKGKTTYGSMYMPRDFTYDFSGTTLEVSGGGIEPLGASLDAGGNYQVRFRCNAPSAQKTELGVRILAGTQVRYEDAIDVTCYEPDGARAILLAEHFVIPGGAKAMVLGGDARIWTSVGGPVDVWGDSPSNLIGSGARLADGGPLSLVSQSFYPPMGDFLVVRADRLGSDPVIIDGPFQTVAQMEIVPDDAWKLKVYVDYDHNNPGTLEFAGYPELLDGGVAAGVYEACTFHLSSDAGITVRPEECSGFGMPGEVADAGQVCIDALGRTACATWGK